MLIKLMYFQLYFVTFITFSTFITFTNSHSCVPRLFTFNRRESGYTIDYNTRNAILRNGKLTLLLTKETGGTRLSINQKIQYGSIEARLKIAPGSNIVSSFILMADNGDEIDFEFVGKDDNIIQTNFFYRGIPIYDKNAKFYAVKTKLSQTFHTYTINWTPEYYEWKFNQFILRRLYKKDTVNFPNSPSKIQFGIWRANPSKWGGPGVQWNQAPFKYEIDYLKINCF